MIVSGHVPDLVLGMANGFTCTLRVRARVGTFPFRAALSYVDMVKLFLTGRRFIMIVGCPVKDTIEAASIPVLGVSKLCGTIL